MHISHTESFARWFFTNLLQTFICGKEPERSPLQQQTLVKLS